MFVSIFWMSRRRRAPLILVEVSWHRGQRCCFCHFPAETPSAPHFTSALSVIAISSLAQQQLFHTGRQGQWRHEVLEKESKSSADLANCSKCSIGPPKKSLGEMFTVLTFLHDTATWVQLKHPSGLFPVVAFSKYDLILNTVWRKFYLWHSILLRNRLTWWKLK